MILNGLTAERFYKMPMQMLSELIECAVDCSEKAAGIESPEVIESFSDMEKLAEKLNT